MAGRAWGRGVLQMSTFSAQFQEPVLFHRREPKKKEKKARQSDGDVKENILPRPSVSPRSRGEFVEMRRTVKDARLIFKPCARYFTIPLAALSTLFLLSESSSTLIPRSFFYLLFLLAPLVHGLLSRFPRARRAPFEFFLIFIRVSNKLVRVLGTHTLAGKYLFTREGNSVRCQRELRPLFAWKFLMASSFLSYINVGIYFCLQQ